MDTQQEPPRAIIFDLGDVLFTWSANTAIIPAQKLRSVLSTSIWHRYERGEITRDTCYELSAQQSSLSASEIAGAFSKARESLQPDYAIVSFLRELEKDPAIQVYAMSNVGKEDFEELATKMEWPLFDQVFTSAAAGMRKPEVGFYRHVLDHIGLAGNQVAFIDDKEENVQAARTLGIQGFVFGQSTVHTLRSMFDNPVGKGWRYLFLNAKHCDSVTDTGVTFSDNFAKLLIVDSLNDRTLVDVSWGSRKSWNFFTDEKMLVPGGIFPDDLDTTSLALTALRPESTELVSSVLDAMAEYVEGDGSFQTYFDRNKARVDPIVSGNILACFYAYNRGREFERTLNVVRSVLSDRTYEQGSRYYPSPDCCLGFIGRLLRSSSDAHLQETLGPLLKARVRERLNLGGSALDLAMRIITCTQMGIACENDRRVLVNLQREDGSWEGGWMYQYGTTRVKVGNRAVTTAMAVAALSSPGITSQADSGKKLDGTNILVNMIDVK
ncbi:Haloacid dehalogenase-like hydrolase-domain-containing protein [Hypoxylon trugodes]|uniref:Haloacid dehalogenase-like hydrolase-domain-containing protein n=1 Tax=Hypoxylon trugodes TaxID=326681 RepID=UPI002191E106|nr:Haloacid dehalogenase-like hydrolase-domain-containing protein [Hypoxylon trugodes]KAI1384970.1 Haloacid dehalogenase-like hydrolase-domain-containing protein [Hypoxylon trugodes]